MTRTLSISENSTSIQAVIALARNGDEVVLEENGEPVAKVIPFSERKLGPGKRTPGLGNGYWMSDDFDDELPDEFWGFDKKE